MATFEKRKTGWLARVQKKGVREALTFDTKKEAEAWAKKREDEINALGANAQEVAERIKQKITLAELMDRYVKEVSKKKKGKETFNREYKRTIQMATNPEHYPLNTLMNTQAKDIKTHHIGEWKTTRLNYVKESTVSRERNFLSHVFTKGVEWGYLDTTPFNPKKVSFKEGSEGERERPVSSHEIDQMMFALDDWDRVSVPETKKQLVALYFLLSLETAMRQQEVRYLEVGEVDLEARVISLPAERTKEKKKKKLALTDEAIRLLKLGRNPDADKWFTDDKVNVSGIFSTAVRTTDITDLVYHDSRHEALTRLSERLNPYELARQAGHSDLNRTLKYYRKTADKFAHKLKD